MGQALVIMILASKGAYLLPTFVSGTSWTRSGVFRFRNGQSGTGMTLKRARVIPEIKFGTKYAWFRFRNQRQNMTLTLGLCKNLSIQLLRNTIWNMGFRVEGCNTSGTIQMCKWTDTLTSGYLYSKKFMKRWMNYNDDGEPKNIAMNRSYIASLLTSLAPIDSPESQLSIGDNLDENGAV